MRAIRKMQRVILALFILTLLAFCGLRIYRRLTVDVTPPVITCSTDSIDVSVTAGEEALLQGAVHQYLDQRRATFERMAVRGVRTLDVLPERLSVALVNRYLDLKRSGAA